MARFKVIQVTQLKMSDPIFKNLKIRLWLCGKFQARICGDEEVAWEFAGIFSTKRRAVKACKEDNYFVVPVILNDEAPEDTIVWEEAEYPLRPSLRSRPRRKKK